MLNYFMSVEGSNGTYSIDSFRFSFTLYNESLEKVVKYFNDYNRADITCYPLSFKNFSYRHLFTIDCGKSTFSVGVSLNGFNKETMYNGFIDVNPNKCFQSEQCINDIKFIYNNSLSFCIKRFDVALDVRVPREFVNVKKDSRKYQLVQNSISDKTEYLGQRNNHGFFKCYNKSIESNLEDSLTRLELTMDYEFVCKGEFIIPFPFVTINYGLVNDLDDKKLSNTDKVLIELIRQSSDIYLYLNKLDYRKRMKILPYVVNEEEVITFEYPYVDSLLSDYKSLLALK